jgi:hypothetical protein
MSGRSIHTLLRITGSTLAIGVAGLVVLAVAVLVASLRFARCGPSYLEAAESACRLGAQLLTGAYVLLSVSLVLGAASLTLLWRMRRRQRG